MPSDNLESPLLYVNMDKSLPPTPTDEWSQIDGKFNAAYIPSKRRNQTGWTPSSLRKPYLCLVTLISVVLFAAVESLRQISNQNNGLSHLEDALKIGNGLTVLYNYVPTIFGVLYSILWFFIDSDAKRVEPYTQMRASSSPAKNLFLDYSFQSPFFVPFRAIRQRHWSLATISLTYLVVSLGFPASQGALLRIEKTSYSVNNATFDSFQVQNFSRKVQDSTIMGTETIDQARAISVLDGAELPPWTTDTYAVLPFRASESINDGNRTWTSNTTAIYSTPRCHKLQNNALTLTNNGVQETSIRNGPVNPLQVELGGSWHVEGSKCTMYFNNSMEFPTEQAKASYFYPIFSRVKEKDYKTDSPETDMPHFLVDGPRIMFLAGSELSLGGTSYWSLSTDLCLSHPRFAGIAGVEILGDIKKLPQGPITTFDKARPHLSMYACERSYYFTQAQVEVGSRDESVLGIKPLGAPVEMTHDRFNDSAFEIFLDSPRGALEDPGVSHNASRPTLEAIGYYQNVATIAIANCTSQSRDSSVFLTLFKDDRLGETIGSVYKLIFALAGGTALRSMDQPQISPGVMKVDTFGLVVNTAFAILSEVILAVAIIVLVAVMIMQPRHKSILESDPDSISAQLSILADKFKNYGPLKSLKENLDTLPTASLKGEIQDWNLEYYESSGLLRVTAPEGYTDRSSERIPHDSPKAASSPLPFFMTKHWILTTTISLILLAAAITFLLVWSQFTHGFAYLAYQDSFRSQMLWSFVPTFLATCVEACLITILRYLNAFESWAQLQKRRTQKVTSDVLSLRYASRPPPLVLYLSLRNRHYLIAFVSLLCLLAHVLSISMAGLFFYSFQELTISQSARSVYSGGSSRDSWTTANFSINPALSVVRSTVSSGGTLPSWTTEQHSFLPLEFPETSAIGKQFNATTMGISATLNCSKMSQTPTTSPKGPGLWDDDYWDKEFRYTPLVLSGEQNYTCAATLFEDPMNDQQLQFAIWDRVDTRPEDVNADSAGCGDVTMLLDLDGLLNKTDHYICSPQLSSSWFSILYDADGNVLTTEPVAAPDSSPRSLLENRRTMMSEYLLNFQSTTFKSLNTLYVDDRSGTISRTTDWGGLLITRIRDNLRPNATIPELADDMFQRIFATWFSLNRDSFLKRRSSASEPSFSSPQGTATSRDARMVASVPAFIISISLLILYLLGYIFIVVRRRHRYIGPRTPKSIGSLILWVVHSRMLKDFEGLHYLDSKARDGVLRQMGHSYGFGRFRGRDGRIRLGLEFDELLITKIAHGDY